MLNKLETFNNGIINVLEAKDGVILSNLKENIHYGDKVLGFKRFFDSQVTGTAVEKVIAVPFNDYIQRDDVVELIDFRTESTQLFEVSLAQIKYDSKPKCIYLSLKRTSIIYDDKRNR